MSEDRITVLITTESLAQSIVRDISTVLIVGAPIVLNELTLQSATLNFLLGAGLIAYVISRAISESKNRIVRGSTSNEVIAKLRPRLEKFERGELS